MAGWTEFADHFRTIAGGFIVLALLILLLSPAVIVRTPTDIFPNINIPVISVAWTYTGLNPEDIEARLTTRCAEHGGPRPVVRSAPIEAHAVFTASVDVLARFAPMDSTQRLLLPIRPLDHAHGPPDAPYILVEYGDYECPDCGRLYVILRDLQSDVASRLRVVFRHYPLSGSHHHAQQAAEAAEAAGAQGKFWEMHTLLFERQAALHTNDLIRYAGELNLDVQRFRNELKNQTFRDNVRADFIAGVQNGVYRTPGLFLNGVRHDDDWGRESLQSLLKI